MNVTVVSFKPCWRDPSGTWLSDGGFPLQMAAIASLFDEMTLVIVACDPRAGGMPLPSGAKVVGLRSPHGADGRRKLSVFVNAAYYLREISRHVRAADVVHAPVPGDISFLGLLLALVYRKRLIARYGSSWALTPQTTLAQRITRMCMKGCAGGRNVMLASGVGATPPAPRMRWLFSTALSGEEMRTIIPRLDRGLTTPPQLVYLGRLSPEKGVDYLLRALAELRHDLPHCPVELTVVGDGPQRAQLQQLVGSLDLGTTVRFVGHLTRAELAAHLHAADLCVQPSLTEGFSKAWLDAMAYGVPVLSSRVGAASTVIGESGERGWLVAPGDSHALANTLRIALDGGERWPALRRACRTFVEHRTLDAWARAIGQFCAEDWGGVLRDGKVRV